MFGILGASKAASLCVGMVYRLVFRGFSVYLQTIPSAENVVQVATVCEMVRGVVLYIYGHLELCWFWNLDRTVVFRMLDDFLTTFLLFLCMVVR